MNRSILIFPPDEVCKAIQPLRQKYDPLYSLIGPHLTLVFPFEDGLSIGELNQHIKSVLQDITPFKVVLQGVTGTDEGYLFLNVKTGNDQIIQLHDLLYTGPLKPFLNRKVTFIPHVTIGKLFSEQSFEKALADTEHFNEAFEFWVDELVVEEIGEGEESTILSKTPLGT
jgi:2'-5' RNA ligase